MTVDKFVVDGKDIDDAGIKYTFGAVDQGRLWINRVPIKDKDDRIAGAVKLLRKPNPIQLNTPAGGGGTLFWSSPFDARQPIPTKVLYPVTPGGYTMENLRSPSAWPESNKVR